MHWWLAEQTYTLVRRKRMKQTRRLTGFRVHDSGFSNWQFRGSWMVFTCFHQFQTGSWSLCTCFMASRMPWRHWRNAPGTKGTEQANWNQFRTRKLRRWRVLPLHWLFTSMHKAEHGSGESRNASLYAIYPEVRRSNGSYGCSDFDFIQICWDRSDGLRCASTRFMD